MEACFIDTSIPSFFFSFHLNIIQIDTLCIIEHYSTLMTGELFSHSCQTAFPFVVVVAFSKRRLAVYWLEKEDP
jgi:hypothetical protein